MANGNGKVSVPGSKAPKGGYGDNMIVEEGGGLGKVDGFASGGSSHTAGHTGAAPSVTAGSNGKGSVRGFSGGTLAGKV
jgi:hypothetical protein